MTRMLFAFLLAVLVLAATAEETPENPDFPKCDPSDANACSGHGKCLESGECECHSASDVGVYTGINCQCGGTESDCMADEKSGCRWCSTVEPAICVISEEVCHAITMPMVDTETGDGELSQRSTYSGVAGDAPTYSKSSNAVWFFIGSVLAIAAFAWYFKFRVVSAPSDDMPPLRAGQRASSAFEMHGDGL
jgi:hypothetical protein